MNPLDTLVYEKIARKVPHLHVLQYIMYHDDANNKELQYISSEYHPILLSDVLEFDYTWNTRDEMMKLWRMSNPTYEEQSEECKEFIRNLAK